MNYLKYLVYAMVLYLLFTFIPKNKIYLIDLLSIVASLIVFNVSYDLLEITFNKSVLEGYEPINDDLKFGSLENENTNLSPYERVDNESVDNLDNETDNETDDTSSVNRNQSIKEESIKEESIKKESIKEESIKKESIKKESIKEESIKKESIKKESNEIKSFMQQETIEVREERNEIQALETSSNANLASLELSDQDTNKKEKIKYKSMDVSKEKKFIHGYSYMHTDNWSLPMQRQSVCKNPKPCRVCPRQTNGFDKDLMKWNIKN